MCREYNCENSGGCAGCWHCHCDYRCYKCREPAASLYSYCHHYLLKSEPPRDKYVCLDCLHVWKSKHSKYALYVGKYIDCMNKRDFKPVLNPQPFSNSHCARCGKVGIKVGRNFRPCRNQKEWKKLIEKIKNKEIDLFNDFEYFPREALSLPYDLNDHSDPRRQQTYDALLHERIVTEHMHYT
jgi:hypothetical protein